MFYAANFDKTKEWFFFVLNYEGPNKGEGITLYINGVIKTRASWKFIVEAPPGDGRVVIGKCYTKYDIWYASTIIDELTLWNRTLTPMEIQSMYYMYL